MTNDQVQTIDMEKVRAIITGASGMVGEGVLRECLENEKVEKVLVVGRRACGVVHPKLTEIIHQDFFDLTPIAEDLKGWNACFFCLGMSSIGMSEDEYKRMTYDLTMNFAETLARENPDLTFCYVSGQGTDSTEKGRLAWARVKGKTENDLRKLPLKASYAFRIGFLKPGKNYKNTLGAYKFLGWLYPIVRAVTNKYASTLPEVGRAMINCATVGYEKPVLDVEDIIKSAQS